MVIFLIGWYYNENNECKFYELKIYIILHFNNYWN